MEIQEISESAQVLLAPTIVPIAIAVNGSKNSKYAVKWALDKFIPEGRILFRLLYVRSKIKVIPTPMGNYIPISQVREDVASAFRKEKEWEAHSLLLPYKKMCSQRKVEAEAVIMESDDISEAINQEIIKFKIGKLVLGASSKNIFTRKISGSKMSSKISESMPAFCTVFVISKGKLRSVKSATSALNDEITVLPLSEFDPSVDSPSFGSFSSSTNSEWTNNTNDTPNLLRRNPSLSSQRNQALANINNKVLVSSNARAESLANINSKVLVSHNARAENLVSNFKSSNSENNSWNYSDKASSSNSDTRTDISLSTSSQVDLNLELERLRVKLGHFQRLSEVSKTESIDASHQIQELGIKRIVEEIKLKENKLKQNTAKALSKKEKEERENAERESQGIKTRAEREREEECYNRYTWQEIEAATSAFSAELAIGRGANGMVYKGKFHHTVAAVKVLHSMEGSGTKQFKQEIEILSKIRHPHLLLLLGACPDKGCLIYEYMQNGSLDDCLHCRHSTGPLQWFDRFRILSEAASALAFLHATKPNPIIHRDLKPANILLDENLVCKLGDVGLSTLIPTLYNNDNNNNTVIKETGLVGTFCYIDPEYQRTGTVSTKSDVYALGIVILQMLTSQPPMGLTYVVEEALEEGRLIEVLDEKAGKWPLEETKELALVGLRCSELRRKDRPDLRGEVLPVLERLKEFAKREKEAAVSVVVGPPGHFICPILQEVMEDPYVASDGYTYEKKAIELWLSMNDKSPMTNLKLPNKNLIPNHSLRSGISDWKSRTRGS
ncbi:hypothetical protein LUZ60_014464 [Juncus effusus]|nr:hypothetical protein LUZ60_014464 [Juncus effusus]